MDMTHHNDAASWIAGYTDYLRDVVGAANTTRLRYLPTVQRFIAACSGTNAPDWTGLSVQLVIEPITECGQPVRRWPVVAVTQTSRYRWRNRRLCCERGEARGTGGRERALAEPRREAVEVDGCGGSHVLQRGLG